MISAASSGSAPSAAPVLTPPREEARSSSLHAAAGAAVRGLAELAIETLVPQAARTTKAKRTRSSAARRSTASRSSSAGYAKKTSSSTASSRSSSSKTTAGDPFAFLDDPRLSLEEKLMRLLAQLNARYEEEMKQHLDVLAGRSSSASKSGSTGGTSGTKKKKGGIFGALASVVKKIVPGAGQLVDILKDKTFQAALKKLGGPVLAAGATALGFPALAPVLMKIGPDLASGAVDLAKALDAEIKSSSGGSTASGSSSTADGESSLSQGEQQLELMKLQQLQEKQKEMFNLVSSIFRMQHETRSSIIGNLR
ncbi:hypothetical protein [Anaeromyxobacter sp. SG17]|uniref:hypothetical protein n=1 Tax=Anaeromyxobacter sp. SG17 TaxID=2925405 RepID=UPI001F58225F|nr:hypothetical protein [Anaeromyxobacter sp. SG17]